MRVEQVETYNVNGHTIFAKSESELDKYLEDVRAVTTTDVNHYSGGFIVVTENEMINPKCIELNHMKFNQVFSDRMNAEQFLNKIREKLYANIY